MNRLRFFSMFLLAFLVLSFMGCRKDFDTLVEDPTKPTSVNPEFLFTEAMVRSVSDDIIGIRTEIWNLMVWNQQLADIRGVATSSDFYNYGAAASDDIWDRWYVAGLTNIREMIRLTENDPGSVNKLAIARIWRAYLFHRITDLWGDVPYTEALEANSNPSIVNPVYDTQESIYRDLLNELKEAVASIDPELESLGAADPMYKGNLDLWTRFANSLRLRLAIRISNVAPDLAAQHGSEVLLTNVLIESELQSARFPHTEIRPLAIYSLFNVLVDNNPVVHYYPSQTFINLLEAKNDPRLAYYSNPTEESVIFGNADYVGVPNLSLNTALTNVNSFNSSAIDNRFYQEAIEGNTMSYSEVCFLKAEAALLGWGGSGTAQVHYEEGVRSAMQYFNIDATDIADYLSNAGAFNNGLEQIITEKWITFQYKDGFEPFAELRRTGFPALQNPDGSPVAAGSSPQRLPYPESEILTNSTNVRAVGVGINDLATKVWWAQ